MKLRSFVVQMAVFAAFVPLFVGCTTLEVTRLGPDEKSFPDEAIHYSLPRKSILFRVSHILRHCDAQSGSLQIDTSFGVLSVNELDPEQRYYIDYENQRSYFKDATYIVELHPNQTLKSFNGTVIDQAAPTITATIVSGIKIAALAALGFDQNKDACNAETRAALDTIQRIEAKQDAQPEKPLSTKDAAEKKRALDQLTFEHNIAWTPQRSDVAGTVTRRPITLPDDAIVQWLSCDGQTGLIKLGNLERTGKLRATKGCDQAELALKQAVFVAELSFQDWVLPLNAADAVRPATHSRYAGLVLRHPVQALLRLCRQKCPILAEGNSSNLTNVIYSSNEVIPQFGSPFLLPLTNGFGQKSNLAVVLSEDGIITKVGVESGNSAAATVTSLGGAADTLKGHLDARSKAAADSEVASRNATKEANERVAACLAAQEIIRNMGGVPIGVCQ